MTKAQDRRDQVFAHALARGVSQADAMREAMPHVARWKPKTVVEEASRWAARPNVRAMLKEIQAAAVDLSVMNAADILNEMNRLAMSSPKGVYFEDGRVKLPHELDDATAAAVKSFKIDEFGRIEYTFHDKKGALDSAMKHLGLFEKDNAQKPVAVARVELVAMKEKHDNGAG